MLITFILAPTQIMLTSFLNYKLHGNEVGKLSNRKQSEIMTRRGRMGGLCRRWATIVSFWSRNCFSSGEKPTQLYTFHNRTD